MIGSAGNADKGRLLVDELGYDVGINSRGDMLAELAHPAPGEDRSVPRQRRRRSSRRCVLRAQGQRLRRPVRSDLRNGGRFTGRPPEFETRIAGWLRSSKLLSKATVVERLDHETNAFIGPLSGANIGKMLVRLADENSALKTEPRRGKRRRLRDRSNANSSLGGYQNLGVFCWVFPVSTALQ